MFKDKLKSDTLHILSEPLDIIMNSVFERGLLRFTHLYGAFIHEFSLCGSNSCQNI